MFDCESRQLDTCLASIDAAMWLSQKRKLAEESEH